MAIGNQKAVARAFERLQRFFAVVHYITRKTEQRKLMADQLLVDRMIFGDQHEPAARNRAFAIGRRDLHHVLATRALACGLHRKARQRRRACCAEPAP